MNYFNYYTEIEERFQQARQTGFFLLSPLDWALIESWKESGVPLEAALAGIDRAFEKWRKRKRRFRMVNSLAYCAQEVLEAAREMAEGGLDVAERRVADAGFEAERLAAHFREAAAAARRAATEFSEAAFEEIARSIERLAEAAEADSLDDLEAVEQRLTVLEDKAQAAAIGRLDEEEMLEIRREMDRALAPYRGKMTADQIAMLERQYVRRAALERAKLPRFSLFHLN